MIVPRSVQVGTSWVATADWVCISARSIAWARSAVKRVVALVHGTMSDA
jgi:hypothetical protein